MNIEKDIDVNTHFDRDSDNEEFDYSGFIEKQPQPNENFEDELEHALRMSLEEASETTLTQLAIQKEMDEMQIAMDRSLDDHPDFLELQSIAKKQSLGKYIRFSLKKVVND